MTGTIKCYVSYKGYGFIIDDARPSADLFFHIKNVQGFIPSQGDVVEYDIEPGRDGRDRAVNVRLQQDSA